MSILGINILPAPVDALIDRFRTVLWKDARGRCFILAICAALRHSLREEDVGCARLSPDAMLQIPKEIVEGRELFVSTATIR